MASKEAPMQLLQLPDPCLLRVLQCCANDLPSLFSAARAHSRLQQASVLALSSITAYDITHQRADGLVQYLSTYGHHIHSIEITGDADQLGALPRFQLPPNQQLDSLDLTFCRLQLQPGDWCQGVIRPGAPIKRLRLFHCTLLDWEKGLAAALLLLPGLEHLAMNGNHWDPTYYVTFPTDVLKALQQLTYLEFENIGLGVPADGGAVLQPLQALTRLKGLRLYFDGEAAAAVNSTMLSGMQHLTRLELFGLSELDPGALAPHTQLQHLELSDCLIRGAAAGVGQLLFHMQRLQHLTELQFCCHDDPPGPVASYSALTASSRLRHLQISACKLPTGVWQHVFPAGRQLPHLHSLDVDSNELPSGGHATAPDGQRLVSCCPSLRLLSMQVCT
jgi:hypothetical protein